MTGKLKWEWTIPNVLSLIRIALVPVFVLLYRRSEDSIEYLYWALGILVISGLSDLLDGWIARRFHQISEVGKLLDPIADKLTQIAVILCVALRHSGLWWLFAICFVKEALQAIGGVLLLSRHAKVEGSRWYGKIATTLFYITMAFVVFSDYYLAPYRSVTSVISLVLLILLSLCMLIAFIGYLRLFFRIKQAPSSSEKTKEKED